MDNSSSSRIARCVLHVWLDVNHRDRNFLFNSINFLTYYKHYRDWQQYKIFKNLEVWEILKKKLECFFFMKISTALQMHVYIIQHQYIPQNPNGTLWNVQQIFFYIRKKCVIMPTKVCTDIGHAYIYCQDFMVICKLIILFTKSVIHV